jgi:hypothetical protein
MDLTADHQLIWTAVIKRKTKNKAKRISHQQYKKSFEGKARKRALMHALDIRKFEIKLYWKRATYFWTFIGATLGAYGALQATNVHQDVRDDLSVISSCLGLVFSWGWYLANRGSKQWQENWEDHVDMLENRHIGPLYKTVLQRPEPKGLQQRIERFVSGPGAFSVSKINQIISLFVTILWIGLLWKSLHISPSSPIDWTYAGVVALTVATCILLWCSGQTNRENHLQIATQRTNHIAPFFPKEEEE